MEAVLEVEIESYKMQLVQVNASIDSSIDDSKKAELIELRDDIQQLIDLTQQNLLERKKQQLLSLLDSDEEEDEQTVETKDEEAPPQESYLGKKCRVAYKTSKMHSTSSLHNAVVYEEIEGQESVRVIFSNPIEMGMVPCPFFLDGRCRFDDSKCRYSHGEVVAISDLHDFCEPNYSSLCEGSSVLAKSGQLWKQATVDMTTDNEVLVKWNEQNVENLPFEAIWPLDSSEEPFENEATVSFYEDDIILHIDPSADRLGGWEEHTRGIGSKLMAKMGYVFGAGLGKDGSGRVEPVPTQVYPAGKSLDWIHENKEKIQAKDTSIVKKVREAKPKKQSANMFDIVNAACSTSSSRPNILKTDSESENDTLNVKSFKVDQNIAKLKQDIRKMHQSANNQKKDKATYSNMQRKIKILEGQLSHMENKSTSIEKSKEVERERKRLMKF